MIIAAAAALFLTPTVVVNWPLWELTWCVFCLFLSKIQITQGHLVRLAELIEPIFLQNGRNTITGSWTLISE